jgi:hypothetical protein
MSQVFSFQNRHSKKKLKYQTVIFAKIVKVKISSKKSPLNYLYILQFSILANLFRDNQSRFAEFLIYF